MNCAEVKGQLSAYLDKMLPAAVMTTVEQHLVGCTDCREEMERLSQTITALGRLGLATPPDGFRQGWQTKIEQQKPGSKISRLVTRGWVPLGAAAAVLVLVAWSLASGLIGLPGDSKQISYRTTMNQADEAKREMAPSAAPAPSFERAEKGMAVAPQMSMAADGGYGGAGPTAEKDMTMAVEGGATTGYNLAPVTMPVERKVIKQGYLELETKNIDDIVSRVTFLVGEAGGYVQSDSVSIEKERSRADITLRVPEPRFEKLLAEIEGLAKVRNRRLSGQDVSMEYYDAQARLRALQEEEDSILELMGKAKGLEEILRVRRELTRVRSEIEGLTGRVRYLEQMTSLSTLQVVLLQGQWDYLSPDPPGAVSRVLQRFVAAVTDSLGGLVTTLGALLPWLAVIGLVWWMFNRYWRRF